ncbi:MAG: FxsA family protein [Arcobacteraceae bacterium]
MFYVFIYLFLEITVSVYFASMLGGFYTFLEVIGSAFIGMFLLKNFKYSLMLNIQSLTKGEINQADFVKQNVGNALGAFLLIMPGFLTDIMGVLLQFGLISNLLTKIFKFKPTATNKTKEDEFFQQFGNFEETNFNYKNKRRYENDEIIDVEIIDDSRSIDSNKR